MRAGLNIKHIDIPKFMYRGKEYWVDEHRFHNFQAFEDELDMMHDRYGVKTCFIYSVVSMADGDYCEVHIRYRCISPQDESYMDLIDEVTKMMESYLYEVNNKSIRDSLIRKLHDILTKSLVVPFAILDMTTPEIVDQGGLLIKVREGLEDEIEIIEYLKGKLNGK